MLSKMQWSTSKCGNYRVEQLNRDNLEAALDVIRVSFCQEENACIGAEVNKSESAIEELVELSAVAALDGASLVCVRIDTRQVVAATFNKLQVPSNGSEESFFVKYTRERCKDTSAQSLIRFMAAVDSQCNLFDKYNADCSLEIMFIATLKEHKGNGCASMLIQDSITLAGTIQDGSVSTFTVKDLGPKYSSIPEKKEEIKSPKICQAIFTSGVLQKVARKLGFTIDYVVGFDQFEHNGKTYAYRIGDYSAVSELASIAVPRKRT